MDELRSGLALATPEELQEITQILFQPKFNPLDHLQSWLESRENAAQPESQSQWLDRLEERFRFLGADGLTVLQGRWSQVSYRHILLNISQQLRLTAPQTLTTLELESEIFLTLLERACKSLPPGDYQRLTTQIQSTLSRSPEAFDLPPEVRQDPLRLALTGGGALAVNTVVRSWLLQHIAEQLTLQLARQAMAQQLLRQGGKLGAWLEGRALWASASRGVAWQAARYGAMRGALAVVGSTLWGLFLADLGWRTIAINYTRIIPVVFLIAQIRLTR